MNLTTTEQVLRAMLDCAHPVGPGVVVPPTVREIAERLGGRSTGIISYHLDKLEQDGLVARFSSTRGRFITEKGRAVLAALEGRGEA